MKTHFTLIVLCALWLDVTAQAPQKMSYQAVIRDAGGNLVTNHAVGMKVSILQGSPTGVLVFQELYNPNPQTNANGLVSIEIGAGIPVSGTFSGIDWSNGPFYLKTETDPVGGTDYTITGTSQLLSVPYALYAKTAENGSLWSKNGTNIYYTGGNVGIGTSNPTTKLEVYGGVRILNGHNLFLNGAGTDAGDILFLSSANVKQARIYSRPEPSLNFTTQTDDAPNLTINSSGDISVNNNKIINLIDPENAQDAATKAYVDALITQLSKAGAIVADVDGNIYSTVRIGSQVWMGENLKTTKYKDGAAIPLVTDNTAWGILTTAGYCRYNNDQGNYGNIYGALYNWYTVNTGKLCPAGWHVPSDAEWTILATFLGGESVAGGKMKETGNSHWQNPNTGATNESGFSGLPGGYRGFDGPFYSIRYYGYWWSSTVYSATYAWSWRLRYYDTDVYRSNYGKNYGFSVRCLRDF